VVISGEAQGLPQCHWKQVDLQEQERCEWDHCKEQGSFGCSRVLPIEGIDYGETSAPMACLESIRILLAYASHHNFKLQQMDVKSFT
jgi:hypothetical protein